MAFKDALLCLPTYPDAATTAAVDEAVQVAAGLAAAVTLAVPEVRFRYSTNPLAEGFLHLSEMAAAIERRSSDAAAALAARFEEKAHGLGVFGGCIRDKGEDYDFPNMAARYARTRDICIVPYPAIRDARPMAEAVVFGSGRPVLIYREGGRDEVFRPEKIVVAWDGGRAAARAVADALPLLKLATVEIVTVLGEKASADAASTTALAEHLARHGVEANIKQVPHQAAAEIAIAEHAREVQADLLVMGAFGRSSLREFFLGGVTDSLLEAPPLPVLLAH